MTFSKFSIFFVLKYFFTIMTHYSRVKYMCFMCVCQLVCVCICSASWMCHSIISVFVSIVCIIADLVLIFELMAAHFSFLMSDFVGVYSIRDVLWYHPFILCVLGVVTDF